MTCDASVKRRELMQELFAYKCVLNLHRLLVRLLAVHGDVKVGDEGSQRHPKDNLCEVLPAADASSDAERHEVLRHPGVIA